MILEHELLEILKYTKEHYLTDNGLITKLQKHQRGNDVDENDLLYTAYFFYLFDQLCHGVTDIKVRTHFTELFTTCLDAVDACELLPGLYNAHKDNRDEPLSKDNQIAIIFLYKMIQKVTGLKNHGWVKVEAIESYGSHANWIYNNTLDHSWKRNIRQWRTPDIQYVIESATEVDSGWFKTKWFEIASEFTLDNDQKVDGMYQSDNRLLLWLKYMILELSGKDVLTEKNKFLKATKKKFGTEFPLLTLFELFFKLENTGGYEHPCLKLARLKYEH